MHYLDYNEKITHGTQDFPIAFYLVDEVHPRYHMPFHWHKEMELILIKKGTLQIFLNDEEFSAHEGDILFIEEGMIHGGIPDHCIYECAVFDLNSLLGHSDVCKRYFRLITRHQIRVFQHFPAQQASRIHQAVSDLMDAIRFPHAGGELLALAALYRFFGCIFEEEYYIQISPVPQSAPQKMDQLRPVLEFIDMHYADPITLEDLSHLAGMTPKYFCRYFRAVIHRTPMDYLNFYRVERACQLLGSSELSVSEVGYCCGFNDSSYFIKTFKKYMGITPKQYALKQ